MPLFQSEAKSEATDTKIISFFLVQIKLLFHKKGFPLSLVLKMRGFGTWKQPIPNRLVKSIFCFSQQKAGLTGVAMETMRPSGPVKLESIESGLYKEVSVSGKKLTRCV